MRRILLLSLPLLAGCSLLDQTTFAPSPEPQPPPTVVMPQPETRKPLIVIATGTTPTQYGKALREAIRAAERSKRDIQYDVVGIAPGPAGPLPVQAPPVQIPSSQPAQNPNQVVAEMTAQLEAGGHAAEVMRAIMNLGVPAARIHLAVRSDPSVTGQEVRVFVR